MTTDLNELDRQQRAAWKRAAAAWEKWQVELREATAAVSRAMVDGISPEPGQRLLELAAGPGETGFVAAQRVLPGGSLLSTDQSEEMVAVARRRAAELGLDNVEFAVIDAQKLDLDPASFDGVLCRFGYMLMGDPVSAFKGTRRVMRSGAKLALAVWDTPDKNLWMAALPMQLVARGALPMPEEGAPTPWSMADMAQLEQRLAACGFSDTRVQRIEFQYEFSSFDQYWEITLDLAAPLREAIDGLGAEQLDDVRRAVREVLGQFDTPEGGMSIPATAIVALASA
jgi:ubiquinone/menaquinone biosynthesis C-methylase UbiE